MTSDSITPTFKFLKNPQSKVYKLVDKIRKFDIRLAENKSKVFILSIVAFIVVHILIIGFSELFDNGSATGDIDYYRRIAFEILNDHKWPIVTENTFEPFLYPPLAMIPMLIPGIFPAAISSLFVYKLYWYTMILFLNYIVSRRLYDLYIIRGSRSFLFNPCIYYLIFLLCLGPVSVSRLDIIMLDLTILGLSFFFYNPKVTSILITAAAWIKILPAALFIPLFIVIRNRVKSVLLPAVIVSLIICLNLVWSQNFQLFFNFIFGQSNRGLQVESIFATPFLLFALVTNSGNMILDNIAIITFEINSPIASFISQYILNPLLIISVIVAVIFTLKAKYKLKEHLEGNFNIFLYSGLTIFLSLLIFNKVGSPQFVTLLAAIISLGLASYTESNQRNFRIFSIVSILIAFSTFLVYPLFYVGIIQVGNGFQISSVIGILFLVIKNVLLVTLYSYSLKRLIRLSK
jgi:hypothetical protein